MASILTLLMVITLSLVVNRVATISLVHTGLSVDAARFQARSAFSGSGFTTTESELIVNHPVRRRIIMLLMLLGNAGMITIIATLLGSFMTVGTPRNYTDDVPIQIVSEDGEVLKGMRIQPTHTSPRFSVLDRVFGASVYGQVLARLALLGSGIITIWLLSTSAWLDRQLFRIVTWALNRFTRLELSDYSGLLHISEGFTIVDFVVGDDHWVTGRNLAELRLSDEGITVLGIHRADGPYIGSPTAHTFIRPNDRLIAYGESAQLNQLETRENTPEGQAQHEQSILGDRGPKEATGRNTKNTID